MTDCTFSAEPCSKQLLEVCVVKYTFVSQDNINNLGVSINKHASDYASVPSLASENNSI